MHSFKSYLTELFDNPRDIKWRPWLEYKSIYGRSSQKFTGTFHTSAGKEYQINIWCEIEQKTVFGETHYYVDYGDIAFRYISPTGMGAYSLTGTGNEMEVFSTVIRGIGEFITQFDPQELAFSGTKGTAEITHDMGSKFGNKAKLYGMMLKKFKSDLQKLGYTVSTEDRKVFLIFTIKKST